MVEAQPAIALLWLCGPPGVGKSVVGWELYSALAAAGRPCAFVDIDQLGICYPPPTDDPYRHRLKTDNLAALGEGFSAFGAAGVVVAGVVDPDRGVELPECLSASSRIYRLRAEPRELRQRVGGRQGSFADPDGALEQAEALDRTDFADVVVDTTGRSVGELAGTILAGLGDWPGHPPPAVAPRTALVEADGPILWLWGPPAVGKSTIGFRTFTDLVSSGATAAFIDADQIGFCSPAPLDHRLRARNLAAIWSRFRAAGAEALVAVGALDSVADAGFYEDVLPNSRITWCGLGAGHEELTRRILSRQAGGSWAQPGDPLRGRSTAELLRIADVIGDAGLERRGPGFWIDTDSMSVPEAALAVRQRWDPVPRAQSQ